MFTGIIETKGKIERISSHQGNLDILFSSPISNELKIDQSVAHNGVCLTVVNVGVGTHTVTAVEETLAKTNLGGLRVGNVVNLERCMKIGDRLDGHIVQGHVDDIGTCIEKTETDGSWRFSFSFDPKHTNLVVEKGSICVNGVSLTLVDVKENRFSVAIIPYTFEHTNFSQLNIGDNVNLEFDILGKYVQRNMAFA